MKRLNIVPTGRLLLRAFRAFEESIIEALKEKNISDIQLSHLNVIRHLDPQGMHLVDLARDATLTKQAASKIVKDLKAKGYLDDIEDENDKRAKRIVYTAKGRKLIEDATTIVSELEEHYQQQLGERNYKTLRKTLLNMIELAGGKNG